MKVAILSPITWRTPPRQYGPWEQVASVLTEGLVQLGVDVSLFATGDSVTKAKLFSVCPSPIGETGGDYKVAECLHISAIMERAGEFDIIHNQFDFLPLTYSRLISTPIITTIHGFSSQAILPVFQKYNGHCSYVSISDSDRDSSLDYLATVYNGLDDSLFDQGRGTGDYLLYFGRIHPHKGAHDAIAIARESNKRLIIAGLVQDQEYFDKMVRPFIDDDRVQYKGNVGPADRNRLLGDAVALLHPIHFEEPFGLSVAEAMLCGTPVIAFNRGAMKELINHGETGFLVKSVTEAVEAVQQINKINRSVCRKIALERFSMQAMANGYYRLYRQLIDSGS